MKTIFIFLWITLTVSFSNAQESQSKIAASWKDGEYDWFSNANYSMTDVKAEFMKMQKVKLKLIKEDDRVSEVIIDDVSYTQDNPTISRYVRYFRATSKNDYCLFFTEDYIMVFDMNSQENNIKLMASVGKKGSKTGYEEFKAYLKTSMTALAKEVKATHTIFGNENNVVSIEPVPVSVDKSKLKTGSEYVLGFKTKLKNGIVFSTKNLGGFQNDNEYQYFVKNNLDDLSDPNSGKSEMDKLTIENCDLLVDGTSPVYVYTTTGFSIQTSFKVDCVYDDTEFNKLTQNADKNGFTKISMYYEKNGKVSELHLVNRNGKLQSDKANSASYFNSLKQNNFVIIGTKDNKSCFLDLGGNVKGNLFYDEINPLIYFEKTTYIRMGNELLFIAKKDNKRGIVNSAVKTIISFNYDDISMMGNELIVFKAGNKFGICKSSNIVEPKLVYENISHSYDKDHSKDYTYLVAKTNGKYGFLDNNLNTIIDFKYDYLSPFSAGLTAVKEGERIYYMNHNSEIILDKGYSSIQEFEYRSVEVNGKSRMRYFANVKYKDGSSQLIDETGGEVDENGNYTGGSVDYSSSSNTGGSNSSSTSSGNNGKTNSSTSTSNEKEFTGNVYFKYDMSGSNSAADKLYIHYGSNSAYKTSTTKGSAATVKCESGKVYYSFTGEKKDMKEIMTLSPEDCGKTFKYTDFK